MSTQADRAYEDKLKRIYEDKLLVVFGFGFVTGATMVIAIFILLWVGSLL